MENRGIPYPVYHLSDFKARGVRAKRLRCGPSAGDIPHSDNFLQLFAVSKGELRMSLDFETIVIGEGKALFVLPGQVHACPTPPGTVARILMIESSFVPRDTYAAIQAYGHEPVSISGGGVRAASLEPLLDVLESLCDDPDSSSDLLYCIGRAAMDLAAGVSEDQGSKGPRHDSSHIIARDFLALAAEKCTEEKSPAGYAELMGITPAYLSKAVKMATGKSPIEHLRTEIVTRAKRLLYFSDDSVKTVAAKLGYDDPAYFSRIFAGEAGMSPSDFRKRFRAAPA